MCPNMGDSPLYQALRSLLKKENGSSFITSCHAKELHHQSNLNLFSKFDDHPMNIAQRSVPFYLEARHTVIWTFSFWLKSIYLNPSVSWMVPLDSAPTPLIKSPGGGQGASHTIIWICPSARLSVPHLLRRLWTDYIQTLRDMETYHTMIYHQLCGESQGGTPLARR